MKKKNRFISKSQEQHTFLRKNTFWSETQEQIAFLESQNLKLTYSYPSIFTKISKNDQFLLHYSCDFAFVKNKFLKPSS